MSGAQLIQVGLMVTGAITIAAAMTRTGVLARLAPAEARGGWRVLRVFMAFFVAGYLAAAWLIASGAEHVLGWLVGVVFLGGAGFVYTVVSMSAASLRRLAESTHSRESFQITLDTVVDAIVSFDERGTILFANSSTGRIFGHEGEGFVGRQIDSLISIPVPGRADESVVRRLSRDEDARVGPHRELEGHREDGTTFPVELSMSEVSVDGRRQIVVSLRDISERKQVDRMKSEFISVVSHELRTPLTSIRGSLGLLLGGVGGGLSDKARGLVDIGVRSCDRLIRLINDILDVEKIESGALQMERRETELGPVLVDCVEDSRGFAEEHNVRIELSDAIPSAVVSVDEDRLQQVLTNLVSNAIKFSPEGGVVRIGASAVDRRVRVQIHDDGPGIPVEFQPRLFTKFAQADSSATRKLPGTGLGLSISKAIIDQHGGSIGFETSADRGTTFFFELRARAHDRPVSERPGTFASALVQGGGPRVLICEDDEDLAGIVAETLTREGCVCDVAFDADQAKQAVDRRQYEALFLDLFLPGQDGISLIRELRASDATRDLPIVVVSAAAGQGRAQLQGQVFQVSDWITKPFEPDELRLALTTALLQSGTDRPRVLHVEDDPDIAAVVAGYLGEDAEITHVTNLSDARHALGERDFHLALLDMQLPDGNGLELIPEIQSGPNPAGVLVFSAHDVPAEVRKRVAGVLAKGTTGGETLVRAARRILAMRSSRALDAG